jgi:hypothetical protein
MKAFKALISAVVLAAALGLTSGARAHDGHADGHEGHDHSAAKHDHTPVAGGIVAEVGDYDVELVGADGKTALHLKDHDGKEQAADGFKASVLVLSGSKRQGPFELTPAGGNKLEGTGVALQSGDKVIVTLTDKSGKAAQGRFEAN